MQAVDDTIGSSYCFKLEGEVKPGVITTVSNEGMEYRNSSGSGRGTVIGFWNHASENDILRHGFTFYYIDSDRRNGGLLIEAEFGETNVRIDRIEPFEAVFGRGERILITSR